MAQVKFLLDMVRRNWWIVALTLLAAVNVALVLSYFEEPLYRVSSKFVVSATATLEDNRDVFDSLNTLDNRNRSVVATYAEILNSNTVRARAIEDLQLPSEVARQYRVAAVVLPSANVLDLSVTGPDPQVAVALTNSIGQRAIEYIEGLYQIHDISLLDPAVPTNRPISPNPVRDVSLAAVVGIAMGVGLMFIRELLEGTLFHFPTAQQPAIASDDNLSVAST